MIKSSRPARPAHAQSRGTTLKNGAAFHAISPSQLQHQLRAKWLRGSNRLHTRLYANRLARQTLLNRQPLVHAGVVTAAASPTPAQPSAA